MTATSPPASTAPPEEASQHQQSTTTATTATTTTTTTTTKRKHLRRYLLARHGETNYNKERRVQGTSDVSVLTIDGISQAAALGMYIARRQGCGGVKRENARMPQQQKRRRGQEDGVVASPSSADDAVDATAMDADPPITRTWCSPMTRCRQTYAAISGCCNGGSTNNSQQEKPPLPLVLPQPTIHDELREIELCEWQNKLRTEVMEQYPTNWNVFKNDPKKLRLNNGKFAPVVDCWERGVNNWKTIRSDAQSHNHDVVYIMAHGAIGQCMILSALGMSIDMYGKSRKFSFDNCECFEIEWEDEDDGAEEVVGRARRWRRVHPKVTEWQMVDASRNMAEGALLSCPP